MPSKTKHERRSTLQHGRASNSPTRPTASPARPKGGEQRSGGRLVILDPFTPKFIHHIKQAPDRRYSHLPKRPPAGASSSPPRFWQHAKPCAVCGSADSCLVYSDQQRSGRVDLTALCTNKPSKRIVYFDRNKSDVVGFLHPLKRPRKRGAL